jgi:hypothetical protein
MAGLSWAMPMEGARSISPRAIHPISFAKISGTVLEQNPQKIVEPS